MSQGLEIPYGIKPLTPVPVDTWSGPYTGATLQDAIDNANTTITSRFRFRTMEVRLIVGNDDYKYWYKGGVQNTDLVPFDGSSNPQPFDLTAYITTAPVAANEAAATAQNLAPFTLYKTPGGELRYKLPPVSSGSLQYNTILNSNTSLI